MIRTTIRLEEKLHKKARKMAIDEGMSFSELVNKTVRFYLENDKKKNKTTI